MINTRNLNKIVSINEGLYQEVEAGVILLDIENQAASHEAKRDVFRVRSLRRIRGFITGGSGSMSSISGASERER